ncbi:MAG TPA: hypothetical protein VGP72_32110 [Planctomycetota bacterium]|jgi:hypothetical protein
MDLDYQRCPLGLFHLSVRLDHRLLHCRSYLYNQLVLVVQGFL